MRWLFLLSPSADGPANMALDEALMRRAARTGDAVFRIYGWSSPTLSLGRNQRARDGYDRSAAESLGIAFVRRPTGGRALLHDHEVTYSATLPASHPREASAAYDFINKVLLDGLTRLGVPATRATGTAAIPPGLRPCFDLPADREIALHGRKLVGSAQWRHGGALLQHGSILVRDDQPLIARLLATPTEPRSCAATLAESLGWEPAAHDLAPPMLAALRMATSSRVDALERDLDLEADAAELQANYANDAWTWRR